MKSERPNSDIQAPILAALGGDDAGAALTRARSFAEPLLAGQLLDTGEDALAHADGVAAVLSEVGAPPSMQAAAYLVYAGDYLQRPEELLAKAFGADYASLVAGTRKLVQIQRAARDAQVGEARRAEQTERARKMLLAFSRDLRVVLLRLASRLQTLRWHAASKTPCPAPLALESMEVFAPLANRLGIGQIKWEIEDYAFRFLDPMSYKQVAALLDERRAERERSVAEAREALAATLAESGLAAEVQGRPKHLYSIWKKMRGKGLSIERVFDVRALRIIVKTVDECYAALARVHEAYAAVPDEFDDYIAKPKGNGYQSLHTVVLDAAGRPLEVQIRTRAMHEHAEYGVAAHWAYKEAGSRGYAGVMADRGFDAQVAEARKAVLRQLLAWERDVAAGSGRAGEVAAPAGASAEAAAPAFDDRIYVFTPQAAIVELTADATPVDFAYALHTELGHRCRGAKVDGSMVPLNTRLKSGQTVEVTTAREGGPSLDWLNPDLGYLQSARSRAKVRAWFNALAQQQTIQRGRESVEKLLQREGRTALKLDELAARLGFKTADLLFEAVGKEEYSLRHIEVLLRPVEVPADKDERLVQRLERTPAGKGGSGVLVVGVESLLTSLARCCRPAPGDAIGGYVTRGKGVAVHRRECSNFREMAERQPDRVIPVAWGQQGPAADEAGKEGSRKASGKGPGGEGGQRYPVDVRVEAADRQGLLRDISEVLAKERTNVIGVKTQTVQDATGGTAWMTFTVEVASTAQLGGVLARLRKVAGVRAAARR